MAILENMSSLGLWIAVFSSLVFVEGYPTGAPATACVTMTPNHYGAAPSTDAPPFDVTPLSTTYGPNSKVTVILTAPCGPETFQGFLLEARRADVGVNRDEPIGTFTNITADSKHVALCGNGRQAVTHVNTNPKKQLSFDWTGPPQPAGHIVFVATFAESKSVYWVKVFSSVVVDETRAIPPNTGAMTYPTLNKCSLPLPPTQPTVPTLPDIPDCGASKFCFKDCQGASCSFIVSWWNSTDYVNGVEFELASTVDRTTNKWMAVGFSDDRKMGEDKVVECVSFRNEIKVHTSFNTVTPRLENVRNENPHPGDGVYSNNASSLIDGVFRCSFVVVTQDFSYINLIEPQHLLFATGNTATFKDNKLIHAISPGQFPAVSQNKHSFLSVYKNETMADSSKALHTDLVQTMLCLFVTLILGQCAIH